MLGLEFWVRFRRPIYADETIRLEWMVVKVTPNQKLRGDIVELRGSLRTPAPSLRKTLHRCRICGNAPVAVWIAFTSNPGFSEPANRDQRRERRLLFTLVASSCIGSGDIRSHGQSMIRSYALVLVFFEGGFLIDIQTALNKEGREGWQFKQMVLPSSDWGEFDTHRRDSRMERIDPSA